VPILSISFESSGCWKIISWERFGFGPGQNLVELAGDVALETADDLFLGQAFFGPPFDVYAGPGGYKPTPRPLTAPTCAGGIKRSSRSGMTRRRTVASAAPGEAVHPRSTPSATKSATPSRAASTSSNSSELWPPAMTSANSSTRAPSTSHRSGSAYATRSHAPRDTA
jgi:hypothetical protein